MNARVVGAYNRGDIEHSEVAAFVGKNPWQSHSSLQWIVLQMIEEYARHNGHADLLREAVDGQTGE